MRFRRSTPRAARVLSATLLSLAVVAGCSSGDTDASAPSTPSPTTTEPPVVDAPDLGRLVTIGDSYTAGPGVGDADPESGFCVRSAGSWPTVLAGLTSADLTDVSCSGATTADALAPVVGAFGTRPAQLDAVTPGADVVTVQLGGNDGGLFASLIQACVQEATACSRYVDDVAPDVLATTTAAVDDVLEQATSRAPDATVVLVGYLRLAPETGTCTALGVGDGTVDLVRTAEQRLDAALEEAAERADVPFVSMRQASVGHDACAGAEAWTNGPQVVGGDGISFHPRAAGMQAVADEVARTLS